MVYFGQEQADALEKKLELSLKLMNEKLSNLPPQTES